MRYLVVCILSIISLCSYGWASYNAVYDLQEQCGDVDVYLSCNEHSSACNKTTMTIKESHKQNVTITPPNEILNTNNLTIVGMACQKDLDGNALIVVQYGELPFDCEFCEFFAFYDTNGKVLTLNNPLFINSSEEKPTPNNLEFNKLFKKQKMQWIDLNYIQVPIE